MTHTASCRISASDLDALCRQTIDEIQAEIIGYDERAAIRADALDDHRNTTQRAIAALQRSERFPGEHEVARSWRREHSTLSLAREYLLRRHA